MTTENELKIMTAALPVVEAVPASQDSCWPSDGPAHDDDCTLANHAASAAAVAATEGISWDFSTWSATASWFRGAIAAAAGSVTPATPTRRKVARKGREKKMFEIQSRNLDHPSAAEWSAESVGRCGNEFDTEAEAEAMIPELRNLGIDWADSEYRVVEIEAADAS